MKDFIRAALVVALGLGLNLLCADACADAAASPVARAGGREEAVAAVESIWSTP